MVPAPWKSLDLLSACAAEQGRTRPVMHARHSTPVQRTSASASSSSAWNGACGHAARSGGQRCSARSAARATCTCMHALHGAHHKAPRPTWATLAQHCRLEPLGSKDTCASGWDRRQSGHLGDGLRRAARVEKGLPAGQQLREGGLGLLKVAQHRPVRDAQQKDECMGCEGLCHTRCHLLGRAERVTAPTAPLPTVMESAGGGPQEAPEGLDRGASLCGVCAGPYAMCSLGRAAPPCSAGCTVCGLDTRPPRQACSPTVA